MKRFLPFLVAVIVIGPVAAQSFQCPIGQDAACLGWGEKVCSSNGKCVSESAACFDSYQCDYKGFACKSDVEQCVEAHDEVVGDYNALLADFETLRTAGLKLADSHDELQRDLKELRDCLSFASTIEDAQACAY